MNCKDFLFVAFVFWFAGALSVWVGTLTGARLTKSRPSPESPSTLPASWRPPVPSHLRRENHMPVLHAERGGRPPSPIDTIVTPPSTEGRPL